MEATEASAAIDAAAQAFDFEPDRLEKAEERLFDLRGLARKLHVAVEDLPTLRARFAERLRAAETSEDALKAAQATAANPETNQEDPSGNVNFNAQNLQAYSGYYWGVMGLTLNQNGYAWDFESALKDPAQPTGPASYSDKGVGTCHGPVNK